MKRPRVSPATRLVAALLSLALTASLQADEIRVAVASNFANTIREIAWHFEEQTAHRVTLVFGSTGKHFAQISNGAPFDVFFAADATRPKLLEAQGLGVTGTRFTYAIGKLILWSPRAAYVDARGVVLERGDFRHLALANPRLAPYGHAAREVLHNLGQWQVLQDKIVRGENIGQAFQFVKSGNAELGFVANPRSNGPVSPRRAPGGRSPRCSTHQLNNRQFCCETVRRRVPFWPSSAENRHWISSRLTATGRADGNK